MISNNFGSFPKKVLLPAHIERRSMNDKNAKCNFQYEISHTKRETTETENDYDDVVVVKGKMFLHAWHT